MKLQELPSPYRELAEMRREQQKDTHYGTTWKNRFNETNNLFYAFGWGETPDGFEFWARAYSGNTPEIPASSLAELAEWQKSKGEKVEPTHEPTLIGGKTEQEWLFYFAGQAMQGLMSNRASETMRLMMPLRGCKIEIIDNDYSDLSIWYSICDDGMLEVTVIWKVVEFGKPLAEQPELVRMYDLRITTITAAAVDAAMEFESLYFVNPDFETT